jgi:hypothetical protein
MDLHFESPQIFTAMLALLSVSAACLFTLYLRDERRSRRGRMPEGQRAFVRLSEYRREAERRDRPAA